MRLSALFLRLVVFALAGLLAYGAATLTVAAVENRSVDAVQQTLVTEGHDWASVLGDGLQVILEGEAPSEAARFRAISAAGGMVDASRVIDNLSVADSAQITPPSFAIEILRNDSGVSLIGLVPAQTDRDALAARIARIADDLPVTDLLDAGDYPVPDNWRASVDFGVRALAMLPRSKISVSNGQVEVTAIADSYDEQRRLELALDRSRPEGIAITVDIRAPRPVLSPFATRFSIEDGTASFDACAAETEADRDMILAAATAAGFDGTADCALALGAPSDDWGTAVAQSIAAVAELGGGTVTVADTDIALIAPAGTGAGTYDSVIDGLKRALPPAFSLSAELLELPREGDAAPPRFAATRSPEGIVQLRGDVPDETTESVIANFANAKFGQTNITISTTVNADLTPGWSVRVLAGIEALSALSNGAVVVEPDSMDIRGNTGNKDASAELARLMIEKLGENADFDIDVTYVEQLDPIAGLPTPEECVAQIKSVTASRKITFDPGSAQISASALSVVDDIAEVLRLCGDLRIRIAGYTDSQGREEMNLQLSQQRAEAVLTALRGRRVPVRTFEATGYGEADPIADNGTAEGREANRRIEFSLIVPESTAAETNPLDELAIDPPADAADDSADAPTE